MMRELGYCTGIENYSRVIAGRPAGSPPHTLLDYFPKDFLMFIDESHVTLPQVHAMYNGDRARKKTTLVDYGFRLPCAFDNRPLKFPEFSSGSTRWSMCPLPLGSTSAPAPARLWSRSSGHRPAGPPVGEVGPVRGADGRPDRGDQPAPPGTSGCWLPP